MLATQEDQQRRLLVCLYAASTREPPQQSGSAYEPLSKDFPDLSKLSNMDSFLDSTFSIQN